MFKLHLNTVIFFLLFLTISCFKKSDEEILIHHKELFIYEDLVQAKKHADNLIALKQIEDAYYSDSLPMYPLFDIGQKIDPQYDYPIDSINVHGAFKYKCLDYRYTYFRFDYRMARGIVLVALYDNNEKRVIGGFNY